MRSELILLSAILDARTCWHSATECRFYVSLSALEILDDGLWFVIATDVQPSTASDKPSLYPRQAAAPKSLRSCPPIATTAAGLHGRLALARSGRGPCRWNRRAWAWVSGFTCRAADVSSPTPRLDCQTLVRLHLCQQSTCRSRFPFQHAKS